MSGALIVIIFYAYSICLCTTSAEFYSAEGRLRHLLDIEFFMVKQIDEHLAKVEQTQDNIESFLNYVTNIHEMIYNMGEYYSNPLNGISTIHRMTVQWKQFVFNPIQSKDNFNTYAESLIVELAKHKLEPITSQDVVDATLGLWHLQKIFKMPTKQLADGFLLHNHTNTSLSASDCYHIGSNLNELKKYPQAVEWLIQARARNTNSNIFPTIKETRILEQLTLALQNVGNYKLAHILNNRLLLWEPNNLNATANKVFYENQLRQERSENPKHKLQLSTKVEVCTHSSTENKKGKSKNSPLGKVDAI